MGDFKTKCKCGGNLNVVQLTWIGSMPMREDGFCFDDADTSCTEDEIVKCDRCGKEGRLQYEI